MQTHPFWISLLLAGAAAAPASAQFLPSDADTSVFVHRQETLSTVNLRVRGAQGSLYGIFVHVGGQAFDFSRAFLLTTGTLQADGTDRFAFSVPTAVLDGLPAGTRFHARAYYLDDTFVPRAAGAGAIALGAQPCERLDLDFAADGSPLLAGELVTDQWAAVGVTVSAINAVPAHPSKAIVFDSSVPSAVDPDLVTPGAGTNNGESLGNLLIIAENDVDADADGLVDVPDDERYGGVLRFDFASPMIVCGTTLIDVDASEHGMIRCYDAANVLMDEFPIDSLGDNSRLDVAFTATPVSRLDVELAGSGGLAGLELVPCPSELDFDANTFGVPYGYQAGLPVSTHFDSLGVQISATNAIAWHPQQAILFDTENPSVADPDLVTPGYGPGNDRALGMALIIAENDVDVDAQPGLYDVPDDEAQGGVIVLEYPQPVFFDRATVLDVEHSETSWFEAYDGDGILVATVPLSGLGDNSAETVEPLVGGVRRIELHLGGSGALAELVVCPDFGDQPPLQ